MDERGDMIKLLKRLFFKRKHVHSFTEDKLTVSGYGYTEYEIWFCKYCPEVFGKQTKNYNN